MAKARVVNIVGARPNLMKMAPIMWEMKKDTSLIEPILVHTGQHYDEKLSDIFFRQLDIPPPDFYLNAGSADHARQTARIMICLEQLFKKLQPDVVLVVGDVNSTLAAALVAAKMNIPIAHVEAGLRSFDRTMPEEINRVVTDSLARYLFVTEASGVENLRAEGVRTFLNDAEPVENVSYDLFDDVEDSTDAGLLKRFGAFVGNVMIDTLLAFKDRSEKQAEIDVPQRDYALLTLHRPGNVDCPKTLQRITQALARVASEIPVIFPCHPRTRKRLEQLNMTGSYRIADKRSFLPLIDNCITLLEPLGYLEFLKLMSHARLVLTDSGGIQEETTILSVPCLTLRDDTERPITLTEGTNTLVGTDSQTIVSQVKTTLKRRTGKFLRPVLWDGRAAERIVRILEFVACRTELLTKPIGERL